MQAQKQTRPNDIADDNEKCPAGKKCLLVEDASGIPHWYEIVTSILPDGYTELQYVTFTGSQGINTGIIGNLNTSYEIKAKGVASDGGDRVLIGSRTSAKSANIETLFPALSTSILNDFGDYLTTRQSVDYDQNDTYIVYNSNKLRSVYSINTGETKSSNIVWSEEFTTPVEIGVGYAIPGAGWASTHVNFKGQIYYVKIWDDGVLVRDFIPAKNPDGKIGMYDKVNGVFYENQGTGEFIPGDPVVE